MRTNFQTIRIFIPFLLVVIICIACTDQLAEINEDPGRLSEVELRFLLPETLVSSAYNVGGDATRTAGILMQQFDGLNVQQVQFENYVLDNMAMQPYWVEDLYAGVLRSCQVVINRSLELESERNRSFSFYRGVAKIILANEFGLATSFFGDIPFREALKGTDNLKPSYDLQEEVYAGVQILLDEAINELSSAEGYSGGDLIFNGDAEAWIKTAYAMKARFHIHLVRRDPNAAQKVLEQLPTAISSLSEQPVITFSQDAKSPLANFGQFWSSTLGITPQFAEMMNDDPRKPFYMEEQGEAILFYNTGNRNLVWARNDATLPLISYVELKFIETEALLRTGSSDSVIEETLAEAITASMNQVGAQNYNSYIENASELSGLSFEEKLNRIIEEAYKAYYGYAFHQIWSNYRRSGYPELTPSPLGVNGFNPSGIIPRRYLYVFNEVQNNSAAVQEARDRQNGALLDEDVWAFKP